MRVFIVSDMEGVSGIVKWEQVTGGERLYEEGRVLYTEEINAAVRGAKRAGASEIVVMDCHGAGKGWTFNSLLPELLDPRLRVGRPDELDRVHRALEQGCDAALFVAMHAMAGTADGGLCHTVMGTSWTNLWFNGTLVGETGINAALCGTWACPVVLVTGDDAVCREATALLGSALTTVTVKESFGRQSARNIPPTKARQMIEDGAHAALQNIDAVKPYDPGRPCEIRVEFATTDGPPKYQSRHGVEVVNGRTIVSRADSWLPAWRQFYD